MTHSFSSPAKLSAGALVLLAVVLSFPAPAHAQSERVIVHGSRHRIQRLARRHNLTIARHLTVGGVLEVPSDQLDAVTGDPDALHVAADALVASTMGVTTTAIGADQLWAGLDDAEISQLTGRGIGVAILDSGIGQHSDLAGRVTLALDFIDEDANADDGCEPSNHCGPIEAVR